MHVNDNILYFWTAELVMFFLLFSRLYCCFMRSAQLFTVEMLHFAVTSLQEFSFFDLQYMVTPCVNINYSGTVYQLSISYFAVWGSWVPIPCHSSRYCSRIACCLILMTSAILVTGLEVTNFLPGRHHLVFS